MSKSNYAIEQRGPDFRVNIEYREANRDGDLEDFESHIATFSTLKDAENYIKRQETKPSDIISEGKWVNKISGDYNWIGKVCSSFWTPNNLLRYVIAHPVDTGWVLHIYGPGNIEVIDNMNELAYSIVDQNWLGFEDWVLVKNVAEGTYEIYSKEDTEPNDLNAPILYNEGQKLVFVRFEREFYD